jgi:stage IV sporulation protein FB
MLDEPFRTPYDLNFFLFRIPVRVHPFFWLAGLLLGPKQGGLPIIALWMAAFFLGILCHELGHAFVMRLRGDSPRITLYAMGGLASGQRAAGSFHGISESWQEIIVSAAGPAAGFLLAIAAAVGVRLAGYPVEVMLAAPIGVYVETFLPDHVYLTLFINNLFFVTVAYGVLNLLPIFPLDGGHIARELFVMIVGRDGVRQSLILSLFTAGALAGLCFLRWRDPFMALFFGFFAYSSYASLQAAGGRNFW